MPELLRRPAALGQSGWRRAGLQLWDASSKFLMPHLTCGSGCKPSPKPPALPHRPQLPCTWAARAEAPCPSGRLCCAA